MDIIKILLVDDETGILDQAKIFLEREYDEFHVVTTETASDALELLKNDDFDAIVSDYMMPEMDGLEFLEHVREELNSGIPFIVFTGKGREEVAMKALNLGADRYLQKGGSPKSQYGVLAQAIHQEVTHYKTEIEKRHYTRELQFLNKILIRVSRMKDPDKICEYVADKVYSINEDDYVTIALYDLEKETIRIRALKGFDDYPQLVEGLMHSGEELTFDPDIKDEWSDIYSSGDLERMPQGLYSLVKGVLSKEEAENIEDILGAEEVYSVGFSLGGKPYGGITILKTSKQGVKFSSAIETIVSHLSVILQRRQYEEQLRRSRGKIKKKEEEYKNLFESLRDAILVADTDRNIINCNSAFTDLFGYELEEIEGKKTEWVYHDVEQFEEMGDEIREHMGDENFYYTIDYEKKSGEVFPGETKVYYLRDEEGEINGFISIIRDVTEIKETEKALERSEERYRSIFETAASMITTVDSDCIIENCNANVKEVLGYEPEELIGSSMGKIIHPEDLSRAEESLEKILTEGSLHGEEYRMVKKNGDVIHVSINSSALKEGNGSYVRTACIIDDITERKRKEKELLEERNLLDQIAETSPVCITKVDKHGTIVYANDRAEDVLGLSKSEIKGRTYDDVGWKITDYDGGPFLKEKFPFEQVKEKGEPVYDVRHAIEWPDGERIYISINAVPVYDGEGNFDGMVASINDITEDIQRKKELVEVKERYDALFERSMDAVYIHDLSGNFLDANQATLDMLGYEREDIPEMEFVDLLPEDQMEKAFETLEKIVEAGSQDELTQFRLKRKDGSEVLIETKSSMIYKDGEPYALLGIGRDITERKELEKKLKEREERFRSLFESSRDAVMTLKPPEWKYTSANPAAVEMFTAEDEVDFCSRYPWDYSPEKQPDGQRSKVKAKKMINKAMDEGEAFFEWTHKRIDGEKFSATVLLSKVEVGDESFLQATVRDITERKEKEEKLKKERKKFQEIFNNANDAIYLHELTEEGMPGKFIEVNETAIEMLGYSREEFLKMSPEKIDAAEKANEVPEVMKELVAEGEVKFEMMHQAKDGTKIPVEIHSHIFELEGEKRVLSVVRDITERKEAEKKLKSSERKFRSSFEASPDPTFLLSKEGVFKDVNETALEKLGYDKEEIVGKPLSEQPFLTEEGVEKTVRNFLRRKKGEDVPPYEVELISKDGDILYAEVNASTFEGLGFEGEIVIGRDITDRKEVEKERKRLVHDLKERYKELECLYTITQFGGDPSNSLEDIIDVLLFIVPQSMQYPEIAEVKVDLLGEEYMTDNFEESGRCLTSDIMVGDEKKGEIAICYTEGEEDLDEEDPFLREEEELIGSISIFFTNLLRRIEAERKLTESEEKYRMLIEKINDIPYSLDPNGVLTYISPQIERYGIKVDDIVGNDIFDLIYPEDLEGVLEDFTHTLETGEEFITEFRIDTPEKGTVWMQELGNLVRDEDGNPIEQVGVLRDITEKKEAEKALKESRERYQALVETAFAGIGVTDFEDNFTFVNDRLADMLGYETDELEGKNVEEISPKEESQKFEQETEKRKEGKTSIYESKFIKKDGETIDVMIYASPFKNAAGDFVGTMGVITDVTERKEMERKLRESEEKFRTITESSADAIFITDQEGNYVYVNSTASELLGYSKEELLGMDISDLSRKEDMQDNIGVFQELMEEGEIFTEIKLVKKNGTVIPTDLNAVLLPNGFVYGSCRDITERKEAQEREELLHSLLRHDIKNKAQIVQGYLQLLEEEDLREDTRDFIEKALNANKASINLIAKVRLLLGAQKEEKQAVNIASTIHKAVEDTEALVDDKGMDISMSCPSIECKVEGGSLLKEVFTNIIENCAYHSGGTMLKISGEINEDEVICIIEDDGKGIPDDKKETIFEKGYTTDKGRGTGLGMFLVKMLLETYGGSIEVKDSELGGARFDVHLKKID